MEKVNYSQIYAKLTKGISPKTKDILDRRFGVKKPAQSKTGKGQVVQIETLESIGDRMGITRERVRQIEEVGFNYIRKNNKELLEKLFSDLSAYFENKGGFKHEVTALNELGGEKNKPYILFLLTIGSQFERVCEKKDHYNFWTTQNNPATDVKATLASLVSDIKDHGALLEKEELAAKFAGKYNLNNEALASYLEVSKKIQATKEGKLGLIDWPEIKPRGVKDKAFLVFKKHQKPLHFREITSLIDDLNLNDQDKKTHPQTVHNELIKDQRFVLVGRGMYALSEWGYVPGTIKDIITKVLKEKPQLVSQEEIVKEVLSQRLVAKNTVMINLNNKKYFKKDAEGKYFLHETQIA
ncbi:MAG: HTH domain-containing protein [bacterium]|nr:HTH domain-containing protein [bacterium]